MFRALSAVLSFFFAPIYIFAIDSWTAVAEKALSATVFVAEETNFFEQAYGPNPWWLYEYVRPFYEYLWPSEFGHGTGFIISPDGYIVTNEHVVNGATHLLVILQDTERRVCTATLVGDDPRTDIAVLKIDNPDGFQFPHLSFGDSDKVEVGEQVIAVGNPVVPELESTVTMGIVSALERDGFNHCSIEGFIQTDTALNGGNSGSPLLNLQGDVIGIVQSGEPHFWFEGLGFAIPSHTAQHIAQQIIAKGKASQGFLGVELEKGEVDAFEAYYFSDYRGATIQRVILDSPAAKAGLKAGDLILQVDDYSIRSPKSLKNRICILEPSTKIELTIERKGSLIKKTIELGDEEFSRRYSELENSPLII